MIAHSPSYSAVQHVVTIHASYMEAQRKPAKTTESRRIAWNRRSGQFHAEWRQRKHQKSEARRVKVRHP